MTEFNEYKYSGEETKTSFDDVDFATSHKTNNVSQDFPRSYQFERVYDQFLSNNEFGNISEAYEREVHSKTDSKFEGTVDKSRSYWKDLSKKYGVNFNIMSRESIPKESEYAVLERADRAEFYRQIYEAEETVEVLLEPTQVPSLVCGENYDLTVTDFDWYLQTNACKLFDLQVLDIQKTVCAALNSKYTLLWLIGINEQGQVEGIQMNRAKRDIFRQGFDFALSTEFVPALDPAIVSLRFLPVIEGPFEQLYVIELAVTRVMDTLYQLSSGRIFCVENGHAKLINSFNEAKKYFLEGEEPKHCKCTSKAKSTNKKFFFGIVTGILLSVFSCRMLKHI